MSSGEPGRRCRHRRDASGCASPSGTPRCSWSARIADRLPHLRADVDVARAARPADHPAEARRVRRRLRARRHPRARRTVRPSSARRPSASSCACVDRRLRGWSSSSNARRMGPVDAGDRRRCGCATARSCRSARAPSAPRPARPVPRDARPRHAVDRRHRADRRLAGDAVGGAADPAAHRGRAAHHRHRPHRRAGAGRGPTTTRSTS